MARMLPGCGMSGHVYSPGPSGFCDVCQEQPMACTGALPAPCSDTRPRLSLMVSQQETAPDLRQGVNGDSGDSGDTRPKPRTSWTAAELMAADFPEHAGPCPASSPRA
jgi:hypothetical protein